jgi:hypothetical protein
MEWLYTFVTGLLFLLFIILIMALGFTVYNMFRRKTVGTGGETSTTDEGFFGGGMKPGGGIKRSPSERRRRSRSRSKRNKRIKNIQEQWKIDESRHNMVLPTMYATQIQPGINNSNLASIQRSMRDDLASI